MPRNCAGPASQNFAIVILSIPQPSDNWELSDCLVRTAGGVWVGDRPQLDDYAGRIAGVRLGLFVASSRMWQRNPARFSFIAASCGICRLSDLKEVAGRL